MLALRVSFKSVLDPIFCMTKRRMARLICDNSWAAFLFATTCATDGHICRRPVWHNQCVCVCFWVDARSLGCFYQSAAYATCNGISYVLIPMPQSQNLMGGRLPPDSDDDATHSSFDLGAIFTCITFLANILKESSGGAYAVDVVFEALLSGRVMGACGIVAVRGARCDS